MHSDPARAPELFVVTTAAPSPAADTATLRELAVAMGRALDLGVVASIATTDGTSSTHLFSTKTGWLGATDVGSVDTLDARTREIGALVRRSQ